MTPEEARDRQALYREVQYGRISPAEADAQLRKWGQESFQRRPDPLRFDPMTETEWTLPMAAAWFIWRSADAVRDQWNRTREGWRKWVRTQKSKNVVGAPLGRRWKLKSFEHATSADVFSQVGLPADSHTGKATVRMSVASDHIHTPYSRLKETVQSGLLRATWGKRGGDDFEEIPPEYWRRKFEAIANPKKQPSSNRPGPTPVRSTAQTLISRKNSTEHRQTVQSSPSNLLTVNPDEHEELPDLSLTEKSGSQTHQKHRHDVVLYDENNDVFLRREDVILAEQKTSQIEYEQPDWSLGQALGWVAYQRRGTFRSLWETDINPRPDYYGETYYSGFVMDDPASALREALISGKLIGRVGGESLSSAEWLDLDVWGVRRIKFLRADIVDIWPELPPSPLPERPPPSDKEMFAIHERLDAELGKVSSEQKFRDRLKDLGFKVTVDAVRAFREDYAKIKNFEFTPGPRGSREPRSNPKADSKQS